MRVPPTQYTRTADGVHIAYQVIGDAPVDLVWIAGFVSHCEHAWSEPSLVRFTEQLASFARVIVFDKRGTGMSDRDVGSSTLEERMDDARAVMDAVGCERAAICGVSEGAPMATLFAAIHPDRTEALILYGGMAKWLATPDYPIGVPAEVFELVAQHIGDSFGKGPPLAVFAPTVADDPAVIRWWGDQERLASSPGAMRALFETNRDIDIRPVLPSITVPTLVLHRRGDLAISVAQGRYLAEAIPGARYVELPGEDHIPFYGDTAPIIEEIEEFLTGARHAPASDRVLATVLFTDIVESTVAAAQRGDRAWRDHLERHHAAVRGQLARFGGTEVKTTGDGFLATFGGPARAIRCGCSILAAVAELGTEVRVGVHTGEVEVVGDDVAGIAVHVAQRVQQLAAPSEVLVSSTVKDLVAGSGITFADRGTHILKGVPDDWRLFAVASCP